MRSVDSLIGSGGRNEVGTSEDWRFTVALATWSMDGSEQDDEELSRRPRGTGGAGYVSSDADE
jgi:hypothetical protein